MDLFEALIGEGANDPQKQSMMADQLRKRSRYGELGILTGDKQMGAVGGNLMRGADQYAQDLQGIRRTGIDDARQSARDASDNDYRNRALAQSMKIAEMQNARMRELAQLKADAPGKPRNLTFADRKNLEETANLLNQTTDIVSRFKPEYAQKLGGGPQSKLPNALAAVGIGTEGSKEAAQWWGDWNLIYTLPQRNATFGATLAENERKAWNESDINPSMSPEQIQARVNRVQSIIASKAALKDRTMRAQFDPEVIDLYGLQGQSSGAGGAPVQGSGAGAGGPLEPANAAGGGIPSMGPQGVKGLSDSEITEMLQRLKSQP